MTTPHEAVAEAMFRNLPKGGTYAGPTKMDHDLATAAIGALRAGASLRVELFVREQGFDGMNVAEFCELVVNAVLGPPNEVPE